MVSLNSIVRRELFHKQLPIHWYVDFMSSAVHCARELHLDSLRQVKTVEIDLNSYKAIELPSDFIDWVKVGYKRGQYVIPISQNVNLNMDYNFETGEDEIPFPTVGVEVPFATDYGDYPNINSNGEDTGGEYGYQVVKDGFVYVRERGEIQFDSATQLTSVVLVYISNGDPSTVTSSTTDMYVHEYAVASIRAYIDWQYQKNTIGIGRLNVQNARVEYYNQLRILRGRMNSMTKEDILSLSRKRFKQAIKT